MKKSTSFIIAVLIVFVVSICAKIIMTTLLLTAWFAMFPSGSFTQDVIYEIFRFPGLLFIGIFIAIGYAPAHFFRDFKPVGPLKKRLITIPILTGLFGALFLQVGIVHWIFYQLKELLLPFLDGRINFYVAIMLMALMVTIGLNIFDWIIAKLRE